MTTAREEAIAYIEECRAIHVGYAEHQRRFDVVTGNENTVGPDVPPPSYVGNVGGPEWHDEWVRRYDVVLDVIKGSDGQCTRLECIDRGCQ